MIHSHVVEKKVPVDIGVLCNLVDHLCGAFIVEIRQHQMAILHNVTLPRSWYLTLPIFSAQVGQQDTGQLDTLVAILERLLSQLYASQDAGMLSSQDWHLSYDK
jgi:hypothetical protein